MEEFLKKLTDEELELIVKSRYIFIEEHERRHNKKLRNSNKHIVGSCFVCKDTLFDNVIYLYKILEINETDYTCNTITFSKERTMEICEEDGYPFDIFENEGYKPIPIKTFNEIEGIVSEFITKQEEEQSEIYKTIINHFLN